MAPCGTPWVIGRCVEVDVRIWTTWVKTALRFHLRLRRLRSVYDLVKTRLSESEVETEEPNQLQSVGTYIVIG